jgi:hypothetical protein
MLSGFYLRTKKNNPDDENTPVENSSYWIKNIKVLKAQE